MTNDYMRMFNDRKRFDKIDRRRHYGDYTKFLRRLVGSNYNVLDYGCGNGSFDYHGLNVTAYDIDKDNPVATCHNLKELDGMRFNLIVLSHVLEHCTVEENKNILKWCHAHGDNIIIGVPNAVGNIFCTADFYGDITHVRPLNFQDFLFIIEQQGFTVERLYACDIFKGHGLMPDINAISRLLISVATGYSPFNNYVIMAKVRHD